MNAGPLLTLIATSGVAAQCPNSWSALSTGYPAPLEQESIEVYTCGLGPELWVPGRAWNGFTWRNTNLGNPSGVGQQLRAFDGRVFSSTGNWQTCLQFITTYNLGGGALEVYDDGAHGPRLFLGSRNEQAPPTSNALLYVWNGASWDVTATVNTLLSGDTRQPRINTMTVYDDDGPGPHPPELVIAGLFLRVDGLPVQNIAKWNGSAWSTLGGGLYYNMAPQVEVVYATDIGQGPRLYAAGDFFRAGTPTPEVRGIAQWDGQQWSALGPADNSEVQAMTRYDDGSGPKLWVGGDLSFGGTTSHQLTVWDGTNWTAVAGEPTSGGILALKVHDDGRGPALFVAGIFTAVGPNGSIPALNIARYGPTPCRANCDGSLQANCATLNVLDFDCFLNRFAAQDNRANCDGSTTPPALNVLDFNCFLNAFTAGCP
jgi:hypothetical protein